MNFNNKIIGLIAEEPEPSNRYGFIPCYPSSLEEKLKPDIDFVFMTDVSLWNTYTDTIQFLNRLDKRSKKRRSEPDIPCKPAFKIVEDEKTSVNSIGVVSCSVWFVELFIKLILVVSE